MWDISPKWLRPNKITLYNALNEVDGELTYKKTIINNCKVEAKKKANTLLTDTNVSDTILIVIDTKDPTGYINHASFKGDGYTIKINDVIEYNNEKLSVISFNELRSTKDTVDFLEVICQRLTISTT